MSEGNSEADILHRMSYAIHRLPGNRLPSLLHDIAEAIASETNHEALRKLGQSLKMAADIARNKGYDIQPSHKRSW